MSSDPWGSDNDPFHDDDLSVDSLAVSDGTERQSRKRYRTLAAVSVVVASAALVVALAGARGYGTVVISAVAYLLAVLADLYARKSQHDVRNYRRPLPTAGLRVATFVTALWVGWLVASSLAGSG